jgi:hypothetical protein
MKRGEKICVVSMVVYILTGYVGLGLALGSLTGANIPRYVMDILVWISLLSLILICGFICDKTFDDPSAKEREARRQIRLEPPRVVMPDIVEPLDDGGAETD